MPPNSRRSIFVRVLLAFTRIKQLKALLIDPTEYVSDTYQNLVALFVTVVASVPINFLTGKFEYLVHYCAAS